MQTKPFLAQPPSDEWCAIAKHRVDQSCTFIYIFTLLTYAPPAPHEEELENIPQRAGEAIHLGNNTIHDLIDWTTLPIYSGMSARPRTMYDHESNRILRPSSLHTLIERIRLHVPKWISFKRSRLLGIWGTEIDLNWPEEFLIQKWL